MNKLEILDKVIDIEDEIEGELMSQVPAKVIQSIKELYGDEGVAVAKTYYAKSNVDNKEPDECPECAEKAQKLIEFMKLSQTVTDSLTNDEIDKLYQTCKSIKEICDFVESNLIDFVRIILSEHYVVVTDKMVAMTIIKMLALLDKGVK